MLEDTLQFAAHVRAGYSEALVGYKALLQEALVRSLRAQRVLSWVTTGSRDQGVLAAVTRGTFEGGGVRG
jgi:hypothetical protein